MAKFMKDRHSPPCSSCKGACCKREIPHHKFAVTLVGDEHERFRGVAYFSEEDQCWVLPYKKDRCVYLGKDDRCMIYDARPSICAEFTCCSVRADGLMSCFLEGSPKVLQLLVEKGYFSPELIARIEFTHKVSLAELVKNTATAQ